MKKIVLLFIVSMYSSGVFSQAEKDSLFKQDAALICNTLKVMHHLHRAVKDYCAMPVRDKSSFDKDFPKYLQDNVFAISPVPDVDLLRYLEIYVKSDIPQDWESFSKRVSNVNARVLLGIADKYGYPSAKRLKAFTGIDLDIHALNFTITSNNYHGDVSKMMKKEYKIGNISDSEYELYSIMGGKTFVTNDDFQKLEKFRKKQEKKRADTRS